jgi:addiction module HigA family antidote
MIHTNIKPISVGEILTEEFLKPMGINQTQLAIAMCVDRRIVNELCRDKRSVTTDTALILAKVFGNSPDFWMNIQKRMDVWEALNDSERLARIERARKIDTYREADLLDEILAGKIESARLALAKHKKKTGRPKLRKAS